MFVSLSGCHRIYRVVKLPTLTKPNKNTATINRCKQTKNINIIRKTKPIIDIKHTR